MSTNKTASAKSSRWAKFKNWIKNHKILSALSLVVLVVIILPVLALLIWITKEGIYYQYNQTSKGFLSPSLSTDGVALESSRSSFDTDNSTDIQTSQAEPTEIPGLEIKQADITAISKQATEDEEKIKRQAEQYSGYVESSRQTERPGLLTISMKARLPASSFDSFVSNLKTELEVEKYNIQDFRLEIKERQTQLDIIELAIERYLRDFNEVSAMPVSEEKFKLSESLIGKLEKYQQRAANIKNDIDNIEHRSKMSEINITLNQDLPVDIWPENIANSFRHEIQKTVETIINIGMSTATFTFVIFLTVAQWILYLLVAIIPVWITFILLRLAYLKIYRQNKR